MGQTEKAYRQEQYGSYVHQLCVCGDLLERFDALHYKHKVVFVPKPMKGIKSAFYLKNYDVDNKNLYRTITITGKRCIDQFDYIGFINNLQE